MPPLSSDPPLIAGKFSSLQNIWDLRPPVSVEFRRGQHEKTWAPPNTLGGILARVLHAETARMARCPSARPKPAKTKTSGANRARITGACPRTRVQQD